jgi:hypothetical protein
MLREMAMWLSSTRTIPRWATESDLEELGMSADYGTDQESASTHTDLEEEDLETTDTRTSNRRKGPACPDCGGDLVKLEGY